MPHSNSVMTAMISSSRRAFGAAVAAALLSAFLFASPPAKAWNASDVSGVLPPLSFTMTRATDGKTITAADFKGKIVVLFFGYTHCPDICPATLMNLTDMLKKLGKKADDVRVLFVTVDPNRDTLPVLKDYTGSFAPQVVGLRGTANELANLAKRYRVAYSVTPTKDGKSFDVSHGAAVYVFNRAGDVKLLFSGLSLPNTKLGPFTDDLRAMVDGAGSGSWWRRILSFL